VRVKAEIAPIVPLKSMNLHPNIRTDLSTPSHLTDLLSRSKNQHLDGTILDKCSIQNLLPVSAGGWFHGRIDEAKLREHVPTTEVLPKAQISFNSAIGGVPVGTMGSRRKVFAKRGRSATAREMEAKQRGDVTLSFSSVIAPLADKGIVMAPLVGATGALLDVNLGDNLPKSPHQKEVAASDLVGLHTISLCNSPKRHFVPMEPVALTAVPDRILDFGGDDA